MSIAVISDTHGEISSRLLSRLKGSEMIIHLGDLGPIRLLNDLEAVAPTLAVGGNTDPTGLHQLPRHRKLTLGAHTLFMRHHPWDRWDPTLDQPGIYLHGHTHVPRFEPSQQSLIICPGAIRNPREGNIASYVSLDLSSEVVRGSFISLESGEIFRRESFPPS